MTLDSNSPIRLILKQVFGKLSVAVIAATLAMPTVSTGHAVNSANEFSDRLFADSGCLFINEQLPQLEELTDSIAVDIGDNDLDVFPMENSLQQIAQKLITGIVGSIRSAGEDFGLGDSVVNLEVLVRNQVEDSSINEDPYWNYYIDCDKWDVVFNSKPDFTRVENIAPVVSDDQKHVEAELQYMITRLKQFYLDIEFAFIERERTQQFANPLKLSIVNAIKVLSPTAELLNIRPAGALSLLSNLSERIESAGRLAFGLKYVSEFYGDQFESSWPMLQH